MMQRVTCHGAARWVAPLLVVVVMLTGMLQQPAEALRRERLTLQTAQGEQVIDIEVTETAEEKALGLMFRTSLPDKTGMLFVYETPQEIAMWMKNTYIPLDMVFITADGVVHRIEARTEPHSETIVPSRGAVLAVLELAGGAADKLGLKRGDRVVHPAFKPSKK